LILNKILINHTFADDLAALEVNYWVVNLGRKKQHYYYFIRL